MKKLLVLFLVSFMSLSVIFATNTQKIHSIDSEVYDAITLLYISNGYALPSTGGPWSSDELLLMLRKIDLNSLNDGAKATYDYVLEILSEGDRPVQFGLDVALEGYYHTDTANFVDESDWIRGYNERKPLLDIILETWPSKHFYGYSSIPVMGTKFSDFDDSTGPISFAYGQESFTTNLFFLAPGSIKELDFAMPYKAFGAFGGEGWSVQVGRDRLSWGPGVTGNFMLGEHLKYHNVGRVTTYGEKFKYTFATSFFPHPDNYYPIIDNGKFNYTGSQVDVLDGLYMFMAHRLEWRMLADKLSLALSEAVMYQSLDNTLDLRILSPTTIFHNYYIRSNANSLLTLELDFTPIKYVNVYGQVVVDEFALPGEPVPGKTDGAFPSAFGYMAGTKASYPMGKGMLYGSFEWTKTDPYLYLRYGDGSSATWGINYVVAIREYYKTGYIMYDEQFIGYQYGPDAVVLNGNVGYKQFGKWFAEGNVFYMIHGTHDKWTEWSEVYTDASAGPGKPPFLTSPTEQHHTDNHGDPTAKTTRDAVSKTFAAGIKGGFTILDGLDVYAQADFIHIVNPGNISSTAPISDVQLTFGVSYSL
ncbi:MAG: hypothetical protein PHP38_03005 [Sphaerochaetaceae bacterium]|jgi:hypothetical protein|nr:hypothetical protein [Sphaerochaetaceae bacterium]MDD4258800.1 hypothetical protein [Sphaerochaetaceae bacterium]MDX9934301.1 hypothetical protein [Sphaerochaetaceae bacterium]